MSYIFLYIKIYNLVYDDSYKVQISVAMLHGQHSTLGYATISSLANTSLSTFS